MVFGGGDMDICEYGARLETQTRHPWELARVNFIAGLVENNFLVKDNSIRLLDFGCGDGFVTRTLANRYTLCRLVGVDKKIDEINLGKPYAQETERIEYLENIEDFCGEDGSLDGALLLDVLEHIPDDELFLEEFFSNKIFVDRAKFIITCPAFDRLFSHHDYLLGHYRRYSLSELKGKIGRAGGIHLESGYIFLIPLALRIVEVILEKTGILSRRKKTLISTWRGGKFLTSVVSGILYFDALLCHWLRRIPAVGLTCYIICRK